jgi:hypothetical protein
MTTIQKYLSIFSVMLVPMIGSCSDDGGASVNEAEVFTTVSLTFVPVGGGGPIVAAFKDADGDGGNPPTVDAITLATGKQYTAAVKFLNELEMPTADITLEVNDESDQHQVFFTGTAVTGPASNQPNAALTHAYADTDVNGLPVGLSNTFTAATGTGKMTLTLRHMPPVNGKPVKLMSTTDTVKMSGISAIGGETDVAVEFMVTVQ